MSASAGRRRIDTVGVDLADAPLSELAVETEATARWLLAELDRERTITHVIEREGDRLAELRDRMRKGISDRGYRIAASFIERWSRPVTVEPIDNDALAVLMVGSLINLPRSAWTFGAAPLGIDDDRFIETFVALSTALLGLGDS